jgi:hypoxanthine phosphoribosyltransferase
VWVVYPWNFVEDMIDLILKLMAQEKRDVWNKKSIKAGLNHLFSIDPIQLDIAQPGRLPEILNEMLRRKLLEQREGGWTLI